MESTEILDRKSKRSWNTIKARVAEIESLCFGVNAYTPEQLQVDFNRRENVSVLLWSDGRPERYNESLLIGYTQAAATVDPETWTVDNTAIDPQYQGRGLVAMLMEALYTTLKDRGAKYITRDAAIENGYADKLSKLHGLLILEQHDHDSKYGRQRFIRMRIP